MRSFRELLKMKYKIVIFLAVCLGLKGTSGLICHDFVCDANECFGQGTTCDSGDRPCQVLRKVNGGQETTTFTCSTMSDCVSSAGNTTYDGLVMNLCCDTELCNDGLRGMPKEDNAKYCYNTGCAGAGCTEKLVKYLDDNNIGAYCKANEFGCESTKVVHRDPETGEILSEEINGCASSPCFPLSQDVDGFKVKIDCCEDSLCLAGNHESDPNTDYCHVYTCIQAPCMSVSEAAAKGQTSLCKMTEKGCYFSNTTHMDTGAPIIAAGCVGQSAFMSECMPESLTIDNIVTETECCDSNKCNDGAVIGATDEVDPNKKYCHVYECLSHSCMSLEYAIQLGKTSLCEMTSDGCFTTTVRGQDSMIVHSGCVGQTPETEQCIPTSMAVEDTMTKTTCCSKNRCNNGNDNSGGNNENELNPNKDYCHTYSCVSTPTSPCLSLAEAVKQGVTSACEMTIKGCFESAFNSDDQQSILAGCVGDDHMTSDCDEVSMIADGQETIQKCCDTDRCNNGEMRSSDDSYEVNFGCQLVTFHKPYCHMYTCSSTGDASCLPLSEAVLMGKTARCERTDKGCFAMSDNGRFIEAGCIGEEYGVEECPVTPPLAGAKVVCCDTSGCNDALYSETDPDGLDSGSARLGLISMLGVVFLSLCIRMLF